VIIDWTIDWASEEEEKKKKEKKREKHMSGFPELEERKRRNAWLA